MKRHISYIWGFIAVAMLASCMKVDIHPVQVDDTAMVSLTLKSTEPVATRANGEAVPELNENLISSVQCFFSNDGENILFSARKENLNDSDGTVENLNLDISSADLAKLSSTCHVFAVVNCKELSIPEDGTIAKLKSSTEITLSKKDNTMQTSFVMVGTDSEEGLTKSDNTLSGTVYVKRVAAKVNVILNVAKEIEVKNGDQTETWVPYFNADDKAFRMSFSGKEKTTIADADIVSETQNPAFTSNTDFTVTATDFNVPGTPTNNVYAVTMQVPFYTYPMSWEGQNNIILRLPWKQVAADGTTVVRYATYEYQIPVQYENKKLLSNNEYELTVNVGILGNLGTTVLIPSYQVANWGTGEINAELSRPRYFVVDENNVVMNNVNTYSVGFSSSDLPVTAEIISITKPNYSGRLEGVTTIYDNDEGTISVQPTSGNTNPFNVSVSNGKVQLTHTLNNDNTDKTKFDYVPYTIVVRVTSPLGIEETITFVQYPAMYISVDLNTDYDNDDSVNGNRGYAWVNGSRSTLGGLDGYSTSNSNSNPNMITITTTSFNNNDYVIGDPRVETINNLDYEDWVSAPALYGTSPRELTYYYPTNTSDAAKNMISPKFRIASSYGLTSFISMTNAKRRCASYQEDGYPAGRWRVPTAAELKYIVQLSASGYITKLFNDGGDYWAADETIYVPNYSKGTVGEGSGSSAYVRCVYDEWYWGSEKEKTEGQETLTSFTWGDEPREN